MFANFLVQSASKFSLLAASGFARLSGGLIDMIDEAVVPICWDFELLRSGMIRLISFRKQYCYCSVR